MTIKMTNISQTLRIRRLGYTVNTKGDRKDQNTYERRTKKGEREAVEDRP